MGLINFAGRIVEGIFDTAIDATGEVIDVASRLPSKVFGAAGKIQRKVEKAGDKAAESLDDLLDD